LVSIDGSVGEGGGQVLRAAVALAAVMETDLKITNIRAGREAPGMKAQHVAGVRAVAALCGAALEGDTVGSTELRFRPDVLRGGDHAFDVGTAGSVALVLQAVLPPALRCGEPVTMTVRGGTDTTNAPTVDYLGHVLLPVLRTLGAEVSMEVVSRGFFPKGGGEVRVRVEPASTLKPFAPTGEQPKPFVQGAIVNSGLAADIADRTRRSALRALRGHRVGQLQVVHATSASLGVSATFWCPRRGGALGSSGVGKRGYTAEALGHDAAAPVAAALRADVDVDDYLLDQVLLYCLMATGRSSFSFDRMTPHAQTLLDVAREFGNFRCEVDRKGRRHRMVIDGEGL
jgi:RNA 3'-phosphate cyclase